MPSCRAVTVAAFCSSFLARIIITVGDRHGSLLSVHVFSR
jgi:hypothetical protein